MSVGERAELNASNGDISWAGNGIADTSTDTGNIIMVDGKKYEVLVIDSDSQQQIASATTTTRD